MQYQWQATVMNFRIADFILFRVLLCVIPWETALKGTGPQDNWLILWSNFSNHRNGPFQYVAI